jgi:toxin ParE1/3/4
MNSFTYELTAAARLDLLQAWNYLAETASLDVADKVLGDIEQAIERLVETPGLGHKRKDLTKRQLLFYSVGWYLVIYRAKRRPLHVIRVLHAARDIQTILKAS